MSIVLSRAIPVAGVLLVVKAVSLALTFVGVINFWLAILADTGAARLVVANGMRLFRFRDGGAG